MLNEKATAVIVCRSIDFKCMLAANLAGDPDGHDG